MIVGNGTVITRDKALPIIRNGAVAMADGVIVEVGTTEEVRAHYPDAEFIDANGKLIMPGFVNTHHHIYSALARGLALPNYNPSNFTEILQQMWFFMDNQLTANSVQASAALTYLACIENGVTSIIDHHASYGETEGSLSLIAKEAKRFGVRSCLCYEVSDRNGQEAMEKAVAENIRFAKEAAQDPKHLGAMMGLHASFTVSGDTLDYVTKQNTLDLGYHVHVAEAESDEDDCLSKYGMRVGERFYQKGILGPKTITGHCLHVDEEEIKRLAETGTTVVYCAESNMGNSVGLPRVVELYNAGVTLGMGTDGYTSDMLESYKVANCAVKYKYGHNAGWVENVTALTVNNPNIMGKYIDTTVGILAKGAAADVIVIDYDPPTPLNENNVDGHLLFGANGLNVVTTISDGIVRMKDRQLLVTDRAALLADIRDISQVYWQKLGLHV